jgi:hypothetical protein
LFLQDYLLIQYSQAVTADEVFSLESSFQVENQLYAGLDLQPHGSSHEVSILYLSGYPRISLQDRKNLLNFLEKEYCSVDLDRMASRL